MVARSAVARLPDEVRSQLEEWLKEFLAGRRSLDEVMTRLEAQMALLGLLPDDAPSRSSVHRYAQKFQTVVERVQRAQQFRELLVDAVGPQVGDGRGLHALSAAFESLCYDMLSALEEGETLTPKALMEFGKAIHHVSAALKTDADRALKVEEKTRKDAAADVKAACAEKGLSDDVADFLFQRVLKLDK